MLKRSSRLLVAHGCSLKQTLLRKFSRRVILKRWYYSPDLNLIENFFSKLKALLRKAAERHFDALVDRIKIILQSVTVEECANYFIAAGYV